MVRIDILTGPWHAAGNGLLKRRKVLAKVAHDTWSTHIEVVNEDGTSSYLWGHDHSNFREAIIEFDERRVT